MQYFWLCSECDTNGINDGKQPEGGHQTTGDSLRSAAAPTCIKPSSLSRPPISYTLWSSMPWVLLTNCLSVTVQELKQFTKKTEKICCSCYCSTVINEATNYDVFYFVLCSMVVFFVCLWDFLCCSRPIRAVPGRESKLINNKFAVAFD